MTYREYLAGFVGRPGDLFSDQGTYYIRFDDNPSRRMIYRITEVHEDFVTIRTENAKEISAEDRTYVIPLANIYLIIV